MPNRWNLNARIDQPLYAVVKTWQGKIIMVEAHLTAFGEKNTRPSLHGSALRYMNIGSYASNDKIALFSKSKNAAWKRYAREAKQRAKELQKKAEIELQDAMKAESQIKRAA